MPVCLIEPSPDAMPFMRQIAEQRPNVTIYNVAASNRSGVRQAFKHEERLNIHFDKAKPAWKPTEVTAMTCDEIVADAGLTGPFIYKLDTDSHELEVLEGSAATLAQSDLCIIELNIFYALVKLSAPNDIWRVMDAHGFSLFGVADIGHGESGILRSLDLAFARADSELFKLAHLHSAKAFRDRPEILTL